MPTAVVADGGVRDRGRIAHESVNVHVGHGRSLHGVVQVGHVNRVVPVVMDLHRAGVNVRLERSKAVG